MRSKCGVEGCNSTWYHSLLHVFLARRNDATQNEDYALRSRARALLDPNGRSDNVAKFGDLGAANSTRVLNVTAATMIHEASD